ncbi:MAG: hypothetical protein ABI706_03360 [Ilumatobacteraceae bacterium]
MKPIITAVLASIAGLGLLAGCGSDAKSSATTASGATSESTPTTGFVFPGELTIPPGASISSGVSLPTAAIDAMIAQFEAAGMKVDKACFEALLKDDSLRKLVEAGGTPNQDVIKKFFSCLGT